MRIPTHVGHLFRSKEPIEPGVDQRQLLFPVNDNYNSRFTCAVGATTGIPIDCDHDSGVIATGVPAGLRPAFRSIPTG